jgi:hypothetical protein
LQDTSSSSGIVSAKGTGARLLTSGGLTGVNLGIARNFVILSKTGITDVYKSTITGDIGTSPITGAAMVISAVTLGTTSHFEGNILGQTGINLQTGASINGRMLAQTAVTLQMNTVTQPQ